MEAPLGPTLNSPEEHEPLSTKIDRARGARRPLISNADQQSSPATSSSPIALKICGSSSNTWRPGASPDPLCAACYQHPRPEKLFTISEAARHLNLAAWKLRRAVRKGLIRSYRLLNNRILVRLTDIERAIVGGPK